MPRPPFAPRSFADGAVGNSSACAAPAPLDYRAMLEAHFADPDLDLAIKKAMAALAPAERALLRWRLEQIVAQIEGDA